jgi:formylmethanofuran dehydrogenase subunit B
MCDDIVLHVAGNRIVHADRACPIGERWFTTAGLTDEVPSCLIDGEPAELAVGYDRAAEILTGAQSPLVFGLSGATCEAVRVAVALADRLGACIDPADSAAAALAAAVQSVGIATATLGEVRHRADLVIFWHVDPATTHPRHFERYSLTCAGRFVPRGRADRTCVVVDHEPTATAAQADLFLQIRPDCDAAALAALQAISAAGCRAHIAGPSWAGSGEWDAERIERETGVPLPQWQELVAHMKTARYGAVFFDPARSTLTPALSPPRRIFDQGERGQAYEPAAIESLLRLVHDMNDHTRFVALPIGQAGNAAGAEQVLTWQTGYPHSVSFADGYPQYDPEQSSAEAMLCSGRADAAIVVDAVAAAALSDASRQHVARIPTVVLCCSRSPDRATGPTAGLPLCAGSGDPRTTEDAASTAAVAFRVAVPGIHADGTVFRVDHVPLALRPAIGSPHPTAEKVLTEINDRVCVLVPHN